MTLGYPDVSFDLYKFLVQRSIVRRLVPTGSVAGAFLSPNEVTFAPAIERATLEVRGSRA
jgi:hypothetical protein